MYTVKSHYVILLMLIFVSLTPLISGEGSRWSYDSNGVSLKVNGSNASINVTVNNTYYVELRFRRIYYGTLNMGQMPMFWYGDMKGMKVKAEEGTNEKMGRYIHVKMWKDIELRRLNWFGRSYHANVTFDIYIASKNYTKGEVVVGPNTLRYDVRISSDCPGEFVYLEHEVRSNSIEKGVYFKEDHSWREMKKTMKRRWLNFTDYGNIVFGKAFENEFQYLWNAEDVGTLYTLWDDHLDISFVYENKGLIIQDPYVKLPVPLLTNETVEKAINYVMDHYVSIGLGIVVATAIILSPLALRRRRL